MIRSIDLIYKLVRIITKSLFTILFLLIFNGTVISPFWAMCTPEGKTPVKSQIPEELKKWKKGLDILHSSRTRAALVNFLSLHEQAPEDVCGFCYPAHILFFYDVENLSYSEELNRARQLMDEGIKLGKRLAKRNPSNLATQYCLATLYGMRSADRVLNRKQYIRGGFDARRGRSIMLSILKEDPSFLDCKFWIGSYDYFQDVLPTYVKILKTLLFLPGGDRQRGLQALEEVAQNGILEKFNAFATLELIYGNYEEDPKKTLNVLERAHNAYPDSVGITLSLAWAVGSEPFKDRARRVALHLELMSRIEARDIKERDQLLEKVGTSLAQSHINDLNPDAAVEVLKSFLSKARGHEEREMSIATYLATALIQSALYTEAVILFNELRESYPDSKDLTDLERIIQDSDEANSNLYKEMLPARKLALEGQYEEAILAFQELLPREGPQAQIFLKMADTFFDADRFSQAKEYYEKVVELGERIPSFMIPYAYMKMGNIFDVEENHSQAIHFYRLAAENAGKSEYIRNWANYYRKNPYNK